MKVNQNLKLIISVFVPLFFLFIPLTGFSDELPLLFSPLEVQGGIAAKKIADNGGERMRVKVDFSLIRPESKENVFEAFVPDSELSSGRAYRKTVFSKKRVENRGIDNYSWFGTVKGEKLSSVVMTVVNGIMYGHIDSCGQSYFVAPDDGDYLIVKHDASKILPFDGDLLVPVVKSKKKSLRSSARSQANGSVIDVLILYTQQLNDKYGEDLDSMIQNFVDLANEAYDNSGVNTSIKVVHSELYDDINASEGIDISTAINYIRTDASIKALRKTYKADLASLLRVYNDGGACGLGYTMRPVGSYFNKYAYSVVEVKPLSEVESGTFCDERTFAHELGHNMGCAHDRSHAKKKSQRGAFKYSYGYDRKDENGEGIFGTIMSYDGPRITYFSTPKKKYNSYPIGKGVTSKKSAYNVKTITKTRKTIANFK